jgi:hypothetical protein
VAVSILKRSRNGRFASETAVLAVSEVKRPSGSRSGFKTAVGISVKVYE